MDAAPFLAAIAEALEAAGLEAVLDILERTARERKSGEGLSA